MVYATFPQEKSQPQRQEPKWSLLFFKNKGMDETAKEVSTEKVFFPGDHVIIADLSGESFRCEIKALRRSDVNPNPFAGSTDEGSISQEEVIARFACAPALFGLTAIDHLISADGVVAKGMIFELRVGDETGCDDISEGSIDHDGPASRLVQRGSCTLRSKGENQK